MSEHTTGKFITADQWAEIDDVADNVHWHDLPVGVPETPLTKAASDLLDACELMLEASSMGTVLCARQLTREVIAKAKGE